MTIAVRSFVCAMNHQLRTGTVSLKQSLRDMTSALRVRVEKFKPAQVRDRSKHDTPKLAQCLGIKKAARMDGLMRFSALPIHN